MTEPARRRRGLARVVTLPLVPLGLAGRASLTLATGAGRSAEMAADDLRLAVLAVLRTTGAPFRAMGRLFARRAEPTARARRRVLAGEARAAAATAVAAARRTAAEARRAAAERVPQPTPARTRLTVPGPARPAAAGRGGQSVQSALAGTHPVIAAELGAGKLRYGGVVELRHPSTGDVKPGTVVLFAEDGHTVRPRSVP